MNEALLFNKAYNAAVPGVVCIVSQHWKTL